MRHQKRILTWASSLALASAVLIGASTVPAQVRTMGIPTPLALGRTLVREAGLRAYLRDDGPAIHAVISFRSEHIYRSSYSEGLRRFTHGAPVRANLPRPWIVQLVPRAQDRPTSYPAHLRWEDRGAVHWRRTYQHTRDILHQEIEHQCELTPHLWGSERDSRGFRRREPTAVELNCGQTCTLNEDGSIRLDRNGVEMCNRFFHLPRYARFDEDM